jgi:hypothetical protein
VLTFLLALGVVAAFALSTGDLAPRAMAAQNLMHVITPDDVAEDIAAVDPSDELWQTVPLEQEPDGSLVAETDFGTVTAPADASGLIGVFGQDSSVEDFTIALPPITEEQSAGSAEEGSFVYFGDDDTNFAVQPANDGVRLVSTLDSEDAPEALAYDLAISGGGSLSIDSESGGVAILNSDDEPLGAFETPWAIDADGAEVPTHYEIEGTTLTQVIEHVDGGFEYPIVADPSISIGIGLYIKFNKSETKRIGTLYKKAYSEAIAVICAWTGALSGGIASAICVTASMVAKATIVGTFISAANQGKCAQLRYLHFGIIPAVGWIFAGSSVVKC